MNNYGTHQSDHSNTDTLLSRLDKVKQIKPNRWKACCPAHSDSDPSLYISLMPDGRTLIFCQAGCASLDVLTAVGLDWDALFPESSNYRSIVSDHKLRPRTVDDYVVDLAKNADAPLSNQDRTRAKQAVINGGKEFGWVDHVRKQANQTENNQ